MAGKSYIKVGAYDWDRIKKMYVKTGGQTWTAIRKAYVKTNTGWKKVFDTASNRPFIEGNDIPKLRLNTFRTDSTAGSIIDGTADDPINPVVEAPPVQRMGPTQNPPNLDSRTPVTAGWVGNQGIGRHLWGYNGDWVSGNGSAITYAYDWLFSTTGDLNYVEKEFLATSSTGRRDMITNSSTHLGRDDGDYFDKNWIIFRVRATNSAGNAAAQSLPVYIVRQRPSGTINVINTGVDVPETLSASITYASYWYNKPDVYDSYVEWFAVDALGDALTTNNRVAIQYLYDIVVTGTTTKSGTVSHYATLQNKIYIARLTLNNSNTQAPVVPVTGFIPSSPFTAEDSTSPGSALEVTSLDILDYYGNEGTDNRGYIPVGGLFKINSTVTGVNGSTTYRIRYRMFNIQNNSYYGMDGTNYGAAANSAWTTRTGSSTSFGFGGTLINQISVSGTTATLLHNETINASVFGSTTYAIDGVSGYDRWFIEIEVSALKNSIRKYYLDFVGGISYYVSRPATLLLTVSPESVGINTNVTLSGTISALGGGNSYPRQYKVSYGDGNDSGWLPVGEYAYGTSNPTFQLTKKYATVGEYYPTLTTIPDYSSTSTYVNVITQPTSPDALSSAVETGSIVLTFSGGSGTQYDLYYANTNSRPADGGAFADAKNITSPYNASAATPGGLGLTSRDFTRYFWVRKSTGTSYSNWYPAGATGSATGVSARLPLLAPNPPRTLTTSGITTTNITLNWLSSNAADSTHDAVASYDYYTSTTNSIPSTPTGNTTGNSVSFTYTASTSPVTQYFWVKAKGATPDFATSAAVTTSATPTALVLKKATGTKKIVPLGITVTSGSTIAYVSTNGFIGLNSDPSTAIGIPTTGRYLNIFQGDLLQTALFTEATSTTYSIRYQGHRLGATSQNVDYEIKFTFGSTSAEVYIITNNLFDNAVSDSVLINNSVSVNTWSSLNNSTMDAAAATANSTNNNVDDNRTAITLRAPLLNLTTNPAYGDATSTSNGWTASISTAPNPTGGVYSVVSQTLGSASVNSSTGALTASGLTASQSSTVTVRYSRSGYNSVDITRDGTASAVVVTRLDTPTGVSASRTFTDKIRVSWNAVTNAASYGVWYRGGAPVLDSSPDFPTTTELYLDDTGVSVGGERAYDVQAYPASGSTLYLKSQWGGPSALGLRAEAATTPAPVISSITGDNSLTVGGTFSWSFTNSPTAYSIFCTGPNGTVFTTSNAYTYAGTTFRPGYDGTGWQGSGDYTIYVSARNAGGDSAVASFTRFMS